MRRLSRDAEETIEILFDSDYDFGHNTSIVDYEAGSVFFPLVVNTEDQVQLRAKRLEDVLTTKALTKLSEECKISIEDLSGEECLINFNISLSVTNGKEFLWSNFMSDIAQMYSNDDIYDISDCVKDENKKVNLFKCSVEVSFSIGDQSHVVEYDLVEDRDSLKLSYFKIPEDVENNVDWLTTHPDLFTEIDEVRDFKIKISKD